METKTVCLRPMWQIRHEINKWYKSISRDLPYDKTTLEYAKNVCNCSKVEVVCYILIYLLSFCLIYVLRLGRGTQENYGLNLCRLIRLQSFRIRSISVSSSHALTLRQHSRQLGGHQCGKKAGPKMNINFAPFSDIHFNFNRMKMRWEVTSSSK